MSRQNYKKALIILKAPINTGVVHSDLFYLYGECLRNTNNNLESEKYLLKCLNFDSFPFELYKSLGTLYYDCCNYTKSIEYLNYYLEERVKLIFFTKI